MADNQVGHYNQTVILQRSTNINIIFAISSSHNLRLILVKIFYRQTIPRRLAEVCRIVFVIFFMRDIGLIEVVFSSQFIFIAIVYCILFLRNCCFHILLICYCHDFFQQCINFPSTLYRYLHEHLFVVNYQNSPFNTNY